jgi:hypothetical protein
MKSMAWTLLLFSALAFAQDAKDKDVSKPADGALKGGSIPAPDKRAEQRCNELSGSLREQCLEKERKSADGATRAPGEPPPQDPRQEKQ